MNVMGRVNQQQTLICEKKERVDAFQKTENQGQSRIYIRNLQCDRMLAQHRGHQTFFHPTSSSLDAPSLSQAFGSLIPGCLSWETCAIHTLTHFEERHYCSPAVNERDGTPV
jgi:hypothetical protein